MTRDEFMEEAQKEIDQILLTPKARLMNLVMKAWAEGKKNAEMDRVDSFCNDIFDSLKKKLEEDSPRITVDPPQIDKILVPSAVPRIIGTQPIMCNSTATDICDAIEKDKMSDLAFTVATVAGNAHDLEVYNRACDNHIKIVHDMMTGAKTEEEDGEDN